MIATIARKEFHDLVRDGRFRWSAGIVAALLVVGVLAGWTSWRDQSRQRDDAQAAMQTAWFKQPAKNPHSAAHYGLWAFKPQLPLSFVDRGVDPYVGTAAWLEAHRMNEYRFRPAMDATATQRFGEWSAAAVLQQLVPLLIILLAFGAFAGERERGTLRQLASLGVPTRMLIVGKAAGVSRALAVLLVPVAVVGAGLVLRAAGSDGVLRLAALSAVYLGYFAIVLAVTMLVSLRAKTARSALVTLLALWAANGLLMPRIAADLARIAFPTPGANEFNTSVRASLANGIDGHSPSGERNRALRDSVLHAHGVRHVDSLPFNFDGLSMQRGEEHANEVYGHHFAQLWDRFAVQDRAQLAGALVAPVIAVRYLSMGIAGTDFGQHRAFALSAESYRQRLNKAMNDAIMERAGPGAAFSYQADSTLWRSLPAFSYEAPGLASVLDSHGVSLVLLIVWAAMTSVLLARRSRLEIA